MSASAAMGEAVLLLDPADIEVGERIGFFYPVKAAALGRLIARHGQRTAIEVRKSGPRAAKPWRLVVGRHRLAGIIGEGLPSVRAVEFKGSAEEARDRESSENMDRREIEPLERAMFVHALCEAAQARAAGSTEAANRFQLAIRARWNRVKTGAMLAEKALQEEADDTTDTMSVVYGWQDDAAEALGRDKRTIRRYLELYRLIVEPFPDLVEQVAQHPVVGANLAQLRAIAQVRDEGQRRLVIEALLADGELSAEGARALVGIDAPATGPAIARPEDKHWSAIAGGWTRLGTAGRRQYLPRLVELLNADLRKRLRDLLDAADAAEDAAFPSLGSQSDG